MAPTGVAAININGTTIHTALDQEQEEGTRRLDATLPAQHHLPE